MFMISTAIISSSIANDTEYWSKYALSIPVAAKIDLTAKPELRFKDNMDTFYYWKIYLGPDIHINTVFDLAVYYAPKEQKNGSEWAFENLGYIDGTLKGQYFNLKLSDRNRLEYSFDAEELKYRNRIKIAKPATLGKKTVTFFISDEVFYHVDSHTLNENRGIVGVSSNIADSFGVDVSLMHRSKKKGVWLGTFAVVSDLKFSF